MSDIIGEYFKRKNVKTKMCENIKRFFSNILYSRVKYTDKKAKKYIDKAILKYMKTKPYECIGYILNSHTNNHKWDKLYFGE